MKYLVFFLFFSFGNFVDAEQYVFESWTEDGKNCTLQFESEPTTNWDGKSELPLPFSDIALKFDDWVTTTIKSSEEAHAVSFNFATVATDGLESAYWIFKIGYVVFENGQPATRFNRKVAIDLSGKVMEAVCEI